MKSLAWTAAVIFARYNSATCNTEDPSIDRLLIRAPSEAFLKTHSENCPSDGLSLPKIDRISGCHSCSLSDHIVGGKMFEVATNDEVCPSAVCSFFQPELCSGINIIEG